MDKKNLNKILNQALRIRLVEEKLLKLFNEGKLNGTVHTCIGQELTAVCLAQALNADDYILSNHRGHGHLLSRESDLTVFFGELMGKKNGVCGGMGGSQHLCRHNFLSNGIQGGMTPIAAGLSLANKINNTGKIVCCFIGDGTLGEGLIYEAFNIASTWGLPVIYVLENNGIAQSTSMKQSFNGSVEQRAQGFGLNYLKTNIWDIEDMISTFDEAVGMARNESKPSLVEIDVYRLYSHSKGDDNRDSSVVEDYKNRDVLNQMLSDGSISTSVREAHQACIDLAVEAAEACETLTESQSARSHDLAVSYKLLGESPSERINALINKSLEAEFASNPMAVMLGEDIEYITPFTAKPYGGAFKVSNDLSEKYPNVINTPISEAAIVGIGTGLAIEGMRPIVEIMFGDFMALTFDQIFNHACKFPQMFAGQVDVPLVVRTPMGGKRGYGPTHSQSIEKIYLGIPDLMVVVLNCRLSPEVLYEQVFKQKNPVLVIENKVLYTEKLNTDHPVGYEVFLSDEKFPLVKISPQELTAHVTVLCYGGLLTEVEQAAEKAFYEEDILCEIICPSLISPLNVVPIVESVQKSNRIMIVEEGSNFAAYSSEVLAQLAERGINLKSCERVSNNGVIPSSYVAEMNCLPNVENIYKSITKSVQ